jgi:hypothetical protein
MIEKINYYIENSIINNVPCIYSKLTCKNRIEKNNIQENDMKRTITKFVNSEKYFNIKKTVSGFYKPLLLLLFCFVFISTYAQNNDVDKFTYSNYLKYNKKVEQFNMAFKTGDYNNAIILSKEIIPSNKGINYTLAKCYLELKDTLKSKDFFIEAMKQGYYTQFITLKKDSLLYQNFRKSAQEFYEAEQEFYSSINMEFCKIFNNSLQKRSKTEQMTILDSIINIYSWPGKSLIGFNLSNIPDNPKMMLQFMLSELNDSIILQKYYNLIVNSCYKLDESWFFLEELLAYKLSGKLFYLSGDYIPLSFLFLNENGELDTEQSLPQIKALIKVVNLNSVKITLYCSDKVTENNRSKILKQIQNIFIEDGYNHLIEISETPIKKDGFVFFQQQISE